MGMFSSDDGDWAPLNLTEEAQEAFNGVMFNIEQMKKVMEENNMTCLEKYMKDCTESKPTEEYVTEFYCPSDWLDINDPEWCCLDSDNKTCEKCWNREFPEEKKLNDLIYEACSLNPAISPEGLKEAVLAMPKILDSGNRREFETGAVRDIQEGKGRCDLLPLDVVSKIYNDSVFDFISQYQDSGDYSKLIRVLLTCAIFNDHEDNDPCWMNNLLLEVAKHFEEGCKKYGENNWQKGIPTHCYIDSAVRHYLKYLRGDTDEPHDRAFVWNILCCIWTCIHKPELNDYVKKEE